MQWDPISVAYDSFGCNLDHDGETVYLHGMPSDQSGLFDFARDVESVIAAAGGEIGGRLERSGIPPLFKRKQLQFVSMPLTNSCSSLRSLPRPLLASHVEERQTLFHMTLARVDKAYPTDDIVSHFLQKNTTFGTLNMNKFVTDGQHFKAKSK